MKTITLGAIQFYQWFLSGLIKQLTGTQVFCRYQTTCSVYSMDVIKQEGVIKGSILALKRILSCNPLTA